MGEALRTADCRGPSHARRARRPVLRPMLSEPSTPGSGSLIPLMRLAKERAGKLGRFNHEQLNQIANMPTKLSVDRKQLAEAVSAIAPICKKNSPKEILKYLHFSASPNGSLRVFATDL